MGAVAARPRIEGEGTSGRVWQAWLPALACADMAHVAGLLPAQRLVVVAPHPDDEVLACDKEAFNRFFHAMLEAAAKIPH